MVNNVNLKFISTVIIYFLQKTLITCAAITLTAFRTTGRGTERMTANRKVLQMTELCVDLLSYPSHLVIVWVELFVCEKTLICCLNTVIILQLIENSG